jgi:hypothetical protein
MAVCPRCNANLPEGTERCLVCGYGLPGTAAESDDPKPPEPVGKTGAGAEEGTEPAGVGFPATTQQGYPSEADTAFLAADAGAPAWAPGSEGTTVLQTTAAEPPRRRFPINMLLIVVVAAIAIALLVFALTSGSGSGSNPPHSHTTTTV